jgi:2-C-methyl-D-erythritol 4-phosphate cytidylyltransferase
VNVAVIFAGGVGSRMNGAALPKQFLEVHGKPIIIHTLEHFEMHPDIDAIAVAILPQYNDHLKRLLTRFEITKVKWIVGGGSTGQESRHVALQAVAGECPEDTVVLIHDGVRPLINGALISENIESVHLHGSAITCTKFNETVVSSQTQHIDAVIPREHIYAAGAPQSFRLGEILDLYDRAVADGENNSIDSCTLMNHYGREIYRVDGPRSNIKITTAEDFYVCRAFFETIENRQIEGI